MLEIVFRRRRLFAPLMAAALVSAILGWEGVSSAGGGSSASPPVAATLALDLRPGTEQFRLISPAGQTIQSQPVALSGTCTLPTGGATSPTLIEVLGAEGGTDLAFADRPARPVGYVDHGLGVQGQKDGNGKPCGRVSAGATATAGQSLRLSLTGRTAGFAVARAVLDIEGKFGSNDRPASLRVDLLSNGVVAASRAFDCSSGSSSDCGPDSGGSDNFDIRLGFTGGFGEGVYFDSMVLTAVSGAFSLEGGSDTTSGTSFELVSVLGCDTPVTETSGGVTATVVLLTGGGSCAVPYVLAIRDSHRVFFDEFTPHESRFTTRIDWGLLTEADARRTTMIQLDPLAEPEPVRFCVENPDGSYAHPTETTGTWWCQIDSVQTVERDPSGSWVRVVETFHGTGDPLWIK